MDERNQAIHDTIAKGRKRLRGLAPNDPKRLHCVATIAYAVYKMVDVDTNLNNLNETISMMREVQSSLAPVCEPDGDFVRLLGTLVYTRFEKTSDKRDLDEAIILMLFIYSGMVDERDAAAQLPALEILTTALFETHKLNVDIDPQAMSKDLDDALRFLRLWLLIPQPEDTRFHFIMRTSGLCFTAFKHYKNSSLLDEALRHLQKLDEVQVTLDIEEQSTYLMHFSALLWQRFENGSDPEDLNKSIERGKDALARNPDGVPHIFFHHLAMRLSTRYKLRQVKTDLENSIKFDSRAIELASEDHPASVKNGRMNRPIQIQNAYIHATAADRAQSVPY